MSSKMQSINFSDGYKSFCINDDPDRVIRFNPMGNSMLLGLFSFRADKQASDKE